MTHPLPSITRPLAVASALVAIVGCADQPRAQKSGADHERIHATTSVEPLGTLNDQETAAVSLAAGRVLLHTEEARRAIAESDAGAAAKEIDQALLLMRIISSTVPKLETSTTIKAGGLEYVDKRKSGPRYVQVLDELHATDVVTPILQAKAKVDRSKKASTTSKSHADASAGSSPADASEAFITHSSVRLDIRNAARLLGQAKKELAAKKTDAAAADLGAIEVDCVVVEVDQVELPLAEAADDLMIADAEFRNGKQGQARESLRAASDALARYGAVAGKARSSSVDKLRKEVRTFTARLDDEAKVEAALKDASAKVKQWWSRVRTWFKKK